jgi:hypothetical protein
VLGEPLSHWADIRFEREVGDVLAPAFGENVPNEVADPWIDDDPSRRRRHFQLIEQLRPDES